MAVGEASKIHAVSYGYRKAARKSNLAIVRARPSGVATNAHRGDVALAGGGAGRGTHGRFQASSLKRKLGSSHPDPGGGNGADGGVVGLILGLAHTNSEINLARLRARETPIHGRRIAYLSTDGVGRRAVAHGIAHHTHGQH